jgi:hypothetical protein
MLAAFSGRPATKWQLKQVSDLFFISRHLLAGEASKEPSAGFNLVRRSRSPRDERWGTEPEGWVDDLPYAVFGVGVNYSPLEFIQLTIRIARSQPE